MGKSFVDKRYEIQTINAACRIYIMNKTILCISHISENTNKQNYVYLQLNITAIYDLVVSCI